MFTEPLWSLDNLPLATLCVLLIAAAAIDCWKLKVPNWLTFGMILSGWFFGAVWAGFWGFWAAFVLMWFGLLLLLPVYSVGGMGAGDVKMQMGFGAWVGALYGLSEGFWIVLYGFCLAAVIGGVIALGMIICRGDYRRNRQNTADIVKDWLTAGSVNEVASRAQERKPRMHLLPYGLPLCLGFIGYLIVRGM
jgi:prepilin peptidase CpaA